MTILVTGGAGYIGAHVVRLLQERGEKVVVVDDLSTGRADRVGDAVLVEVDVASPEAVDVLTRAMTEHDVRAVVHFAARKQVGESVERPAWYYQQNVGGFTNLVTAMQAAGVDRLVFSSSAATYGMPSVSLVEEKLHAEPINPYGETKLVGEWLGRAASRAWGLRFVALRYFNVAGAGWPDLGDPAVLNLVPMVLDRLERGERPKIFGDDYPTPDGTCIRDYIHVLDLAQAHLAALERGRASVRRLQRRHGRGLLGARGDRRDRARQRARRHAGGPAAPRGRPAAARREPPPHQRALRLARHERPAGDHRVGVGGLAGRAPPHRHDARGRLRGVKSGVPCDPTSLSMLRIDRGGAPATEGGTTTWATRATRHGCTT